MPEMKRHWLLLASVCTLVAKVCQAAADTAPALSGLRTVRLPAPGPQAPPPPGAAPSWPNLNPGAERALTAFAMKLAGSSGQAIATALNLASANAAHALVSKGRRLAINHPGHPLHEQAVAQLAPSEAA